MSNTQCRDRAAESRTRDNVEQRRNRAWLSVAEAIEDQINSGRRVACVTFPFLYDTVQRPRRRHLARQDASGESDLQLRQRLCGACPVLERCLAYAETGPEVSGYLPTPDLRQMREEAA